jgi:hypothetical protein
MEAGCSLPHLQESATLLYPQQKKKKKNPVHARIPLI